MTGTAGTGPTVCDADTGVCSNVKALPIATEALGWSAINWVITSVIIIVVLIVVVPPVLVTAAARRKR
jgi:hypothetical protein